MRTIRHHKRAWILCSVAVTVGVCLLIPTAILSGGTAGAVDHSLRAHSHGFRSAAATSSSTSHPPKAFSQEFTTNTEYFCPADSSPPCDGNASAGDYGTIDRLASGFSNGGDGNYAPFTPALDTSGGYMAVVSGAADENQGLNCPEQGQAGYCVGPKAFFGTGAAQGAENKYPKNGFTVTADLYLSPTTAGTEGSLVDADVELNTNQGTYGIDEIITACYESGGFVINFGNTSPGSCAGTPVATSDGWYRFVWVFSEDTGYAYLAEYVYSESSTKSPIAEATPAPVGGAGPTKARDWGGPGYFWLPTEDFSGLPLANFDLQLGVNTKGEAA